MVNVTVFFGGLPIYLPNKQKTPFSKKFTTQTGWLFTNQYLKYILNLIRQTNTIHVM